MLECASRIVAVTVYARGALVTRRLELPDALPSGALWLVTSGVSPLAEPGSMRADVGGDREVLGVASRIVVPSTGEVSGELMRRIRELRLEHERLERVRDDLRARSQMLDEIGVSVGMKPRRLSFDVGLRTADALAAVELADDLRGDLDARLREVDQQLRAQARALAAAELEGEQASSSERAGAGHPVRQITVRLGGGSGALERLEVTYAIALARWWPTYTVRLNNDDQLAELSAEAWVAQLSYEDWSDVELALSTADLHRDTELPDLPEWRLGRAQPPVRTGYRPPPPNLDALFTAYDETATKLPSGGGQVPADPGGVLTGESMIDAKRMRTGLVTRSIELAPQRRPNTDVLPTTEVSYSMLGLDDELGAPPGYAMQEQRSMSMPEYPPQSMMSPAPAKRGGGLVGGLAKATAAPFVAAGAAGAAAYDLAKKARSRREDEDGGGGAVDASARSARAEDIEPEAGWLDFDRLHLAAGDAAPGRRGRLRPRDQASTSALAAQASGELMGALPPGDVRDPAESRGEFDHLYRAVSTVDVPSSATPHRIGLATEEGKSRARFRCVPVESSEVYREVELDNPFDAPLLTGPLDVFVGGAMVTTSMIEAVDRGGRIRFGLGVEERLRVARKPRFTENKGGIFGGRVGLEHHIAIELASALGYDAQVDVVDRVPTTVDDEIEIERLDTSPEPRNYDQAERGQPVEGGLRWRVTVPAGGSTSIEFGYQLKLSSKREIVGETAVTEATTELETPLARREADGQLAATRRAIPVVDARATRVTLYEDRAEVRRRAVVSASAGYTWLALAGITPFLDDRSVQVRVLVALPAGDPDEEVDIEEVQVATARVIRRLVRPEEYAHAEIAELEAQRDTAQEELELATRVVDRLERRRQRLGGLLAEWTAALAEAPRGGSQDDLASWRESYARLDEALAQLNTDRHMARAAQVRAREEARRAGARLGARHSEQPQVDTRIEIQLLSNAPAEVELEVSYRTPCALWRPEHLATIDALHDVPLARGGAPATALDAASADGAAQMLAPLRIQTFATVWQRTGELWDDVELVLSTARPGRAASPPLLTDDPLYSRRKTHEERQRVIIESTDHHVETTGAAGVRQVDEMPGVDDGGEPLELRARERVTLASTGEPVRIEVGEVELETRLDRVLRAELSSVAHIRARARWEGALPLLAGPIRVVRGGTLMGRSKQRFVAPGEPLEIGMGPDDAIRVRRRVQTERDTTRITGTQLVEVTVDLFLSNLSDATRHVEIVERIPLSQIDGLEVSLHKAIGFSHDEATGMLRCPLQLGPHATEQLSVIFRIKAPSKMVLPF